MKYKTNILLILVALFFFACEEKNKEDKKEPSTEKPSEEGREISPSEQRERFALLKKDFSNHEECSINERRYFSFFLQSFEMEDKKFLFELSLDKSNEAYLRVMKVDESIQIEDLATLERKTRVSFLGSYSMSKTEEGITSSFFEKGVELFQVKFNPFKENEEIDLQFIPKNLSGFSTLWPTKERAPLKGVATLVSYPYQCP